MDFSSTGNYSSGASDGGPRWGTAEYGRALAAMSDRSLAGFGGDTIAQAHQRLMTEQNTGERYSIPDNVEITIPKADEAEARAFGVTPQVVRDTYNAAPRTWGYDVNGRVIGNLQDAANTMGVNPSSFYSTEGLKFVSPTAYGLSRAANAAMDAGLPAYAASAQERAQGFGVRTSDSQWQHALTSAGYDDQPKPAASSTPPATQTDPDAATTWFGANKQASDIRIRQEQDKNGWGDEAVAKAIGADASVWRARYNAATPYTTFSGWILNSLASNPSEMMNDGDVAGGMAAFMTGGRGLKGKA